MIVYNDYLSSNGATFLLIRLYKFIKEIGSFNSLVILCCRYLVNSVLSGVYLLSTIIRHFEPHYNTIFTQTFEFQKYQCNGVFAILKSVFPPFLRVIIYHVL